MKEGWGWALSSGPGSPLLKDYQGHFPSVVKGFNLPESTMALMIESGHQKGNYLKKGYDFEIRE